MASFQRCQDESINYQDVSSCATSTQHPQVTPCSPRTSDEYTRGLLDEHVDAIELQSVGSAESTEGRRETQQPKKKFLQKFKGWRGGAILFSLGAFISLIIAISVAFFIHIPLEKGIGTLWTGNCKTVSRYNTVIHIAVNAMSTLLLSGSNYCMQCLTAPTRKETQRAHSQGKWLDIGIQSARNLGNVSIYKVVLWGLLALSSVPLHLIYNSVFFSSIPTNDYMIYVVSESFWNSTDIIHVQWLFSYDQLRGGNPRPSNATAYLNDIKTIKSQSSSPKSTEVNLKGFETLTTRECIQAYAVPLLAGRRTLVITATNKTSDPYAHGFQYLVSSYVNPYNVTYDPYGWMCDEQIEDCYTQVQNLTDHADEWLPFNYHAKECLSEVIEERCSLNIGQPIIYGIIVCNIFKFIVMAIVAVGLRDRPLITLGDAVESFLDDLDPTTQGLCLVSKKHILLNKRQFGLGVERLPPKPLTARNRRHYWAEAGSVKRWTWTLSLLGFAIFAVVVFLGVGVEAMKLLSTTPPFSIGFGEANPAAVFTGGRKSWAPLMYKNYGHQIMVASIIANIPQVIFSIIAFASNSLLTSIYVAKEWNSYSEHRKPLRVSNPRDGQRSTYFLQLPYRIAIPFNVLSSIIHWLLSQSIFLVVISNYDSWGHLANPIQTVTCGYSPLPIVLTIIAGVVLFAGLCFFWMFPFRSRMPLVGTCSAAISAACHYTDDKTAAVKPLKWGAVTQSGAAPGEGTGHCCFASSPVEIPILKCLYAGLPDTKEKVESSNCCL